MSGVAALLNRDGAPVDRDAMAAMIAAVPYRGPDGLWMRCDGPLGLAYAGMAVTLEDAGQIQPLVSPRSGCTIVADLRLDNRDELLTQLPDAGGPLTDAGVVLRAYECWGMDAFPRLLGDFAVILWDPQHERMVCARDTSGQRSLFYRTDSRQFAAASEIHQLLQDPGVPVGPNLEHIRWSFTPLNMMRNEKDTADTYYEGIQAIPAGHVLTVTGTGLHIEQYWSLQPMRELRYRTDTEYAEHYLDLFSRVLAPRLRSAGPIGAMLSGGLDSSAVVCTAQHLFQSGRARNPGFVALSAVYGDLECDEEGYVREMQSRYGFEAIYLSGRDLGGRLPPSSDGFLESPNMGSRELRDMICSAAQDRGIRSLLSGEMADNCVSGSWLTFDSLLRHGQFGPFWRQLRRYRSFTHEHVAKTLLFACLAPLGPITLQRLLHVAAVQREYRAHGNQWLPTWMPWALQEDLGRRHREEWLQIEKHRRFASPSRHSEYHLLYPPEIARHPAPWSVEIWRPYADRRLHEFLLAIPPEQKFQPHPETDTYYAGAKRIVRAAMNGIVPDNVRRRTSKTVFESQFRNQLELLWPSYAATFGPDAAPRVATHGFVNHRAFWDRLTSLRQGEYARDLPYVIRIVGLESWLRSLEQPRRGLVKLAGTTVSSSLEVVEMERGAMSDTIITTTEGEPNALRSVLA